ncbi:hypothetical protein N9E91_04040 [Alphaproteobacteria bacterium]|jgi:hypothetical protein|nr:hypothetical protein [Alphaproteobacteria bacterium]
MTEPKFTSFTTADFINDVDMELFMDAVEGTAPVWAKEMKSRGLLKFSMNRVWNKGEVFRVVMTFEYKDRASFEANISYLENTFGKNPVFQKLTTTAKFTSSRCLVVMEV